MTVGPVEIFVIAFKDPEFHGEIRAELERLRDGDIIRLVDLLAVRKTEDGVIEAIQRSDLDADEALAFGAAVGALIGFGAGRRGGDGARCRVGPARARRRARLRRRGQVAGRRRDRARRGALIALVEHRWAIPVREAVRRAGGHAVAARWIADSDLIRLGESVDARCARARQRLSTPRVVTFGRRALGRLLRLREASGCPVGGWPRNLSCGGTDLKVGAARRAVAVSGCLFARRTGERFTQSTQAGRARLPGTKRGSRRGGRARDRLTERCRLCPSGWRRLPRATVPILPRATPRSTDRCRQLRSCSRRVRAQHLHDRHRSPSVSRAGDRLRPQALVAALEAPGVSSRPASRSIRCELDHLAVGDV